MHRCHCPTLSLHTQAWIRPPLSPGQLQAPPSDTATHPPALSAHTLSHTHAAPSTCCTEGGLRSAETMCSDPARPHPLHIQHTLRASAETSLIPSSCLCLSAHLPVFRSLSPPPSTLSHSLWEAKFFFFVLFKILYTLRLGRLARR